MHKLHLSKINKSSFGRVIECTNKQLDLLVVIVDLTGSGITNNRGLWARL